MFKLLLKLINHITAYVAHVNLLCCLLSLGNAANLDEMSRKTGKSTTQIINEVIHRQYAKEARTMDLPHHGTVITFATIKGGTAKTTSVTAFADVLARQGKHILVIDAVPRGRLAILLGLTSEGSYKNTLKDLINDRLTANSEHLDIRTFLHPATQTSSRIDIIPSDSRLNDAFTRINETVFARAALFRNIIEEIRALDKYDYIIFDTSSELHREVAPVLIATDHVIIPIEPSVDAISGAKMTMKFMEKFLPLNANLQLLGIFMTKTNKRYKSFRQTFPQSQKTFDKHMFHTLLPIRQDAVNAANRHVPVTKKCSRNKLSQKYEELVAEAISRIEGQDTSC